MTYKESRPGFIEGYLSRETAESHADQIGGRVIAASAGGLTVWCVYA